MHVIKQDKVQEKIITLRNQKIIIDADVAELYGVETKRINEAVKNNSEKFPDTYLIELTREEWEPLKSKFSTSTKGGKVKLPTGFTERGLYMLATILKGSKAIETTLAIIDTFAKVRALNRSIEQIQQLPENSPEQKSLIEHTGDLMAELLMPENELAALACPQGRLVFSLFAALAEFECTIRGSYYIERGNALCVFKSKMELTQTGYCPI